MYERKQYKYLTFIIFMIMITVCSIQTVKAEGYTPGLIVGEAGGRPNNNNGSSTSSGGGGGNYVPEMDSLLNVPKNEVIDSSITYKKPNFKALTCSSGSKIVPNHNIDNLPIPIQAKNQLKIQFESALRKIKNKDVPAGGTVAKIEQYVCYLGTNFESTKGIDKDRAYAKWKWRTLEAFNGAGDEDFPEANLSFGKPYTNFLGYDNGEVQDLIDKGFFDSWIPMSQYMGDTELIIERKNLKASNIRAQHYKPKQYPVEQEGWYDSWESQYSQLMNFDRWYKLQGFIKQYYYYKTDGLIKYNVEGTRILDKIITEDRISEHSILDRVENVYGYVKRVGWFQTNTNVMCRDEIQIAQGKCERKSYNSYEKIGEKKYYMTIRYLKYKLGTYYDGVGDTYLSNETTDWKIKKEVVDYIDADAMIETSTPPESESKICDYIPIEATRKSCRAYYRGDGGFSNKEEDIMKVYCPCVPLSNLTD